MWKTNDADTKKILYVQTHGEKDPERTATPFFLATAARPWITKCVFTLP